MIVDLIGQFLIVIVEVVLILCFVWFGVIILGLIKETIKELKEK